MGPASIAALVLNAIPSLIQGGIGISQQRKAKQIEDQTVRPDAEVAPAISDMVKYAYGRTFANDIPGGDLYRNEIKGATAAGIKAASALGSGSEAYGMLGQLVGREQNAFADLGRTTAEQIAGYQKDYMNTLPALGDEQNRVWNWNEAQPYLQAVEIAQRLRESGTKNLYSGAANLFGSSAEAVSPEFSTSMLFGDTGIGKKADVSLSEILQRIGKWRKSDYTPVGPGE